MFTDIIYRYLEKHYSKKFHINPNFCMSIDLFNGQQVNYSEIQNGTYKILIDSTIAEVRKI